MIILVWAEDDKEGISKNGKIPWYIKEDLDLFKQITTNNIVVMGYKTYKSIGKPLPNRKNIILSRNHLSELNENVYFYNDIESLKNNFMNKNLYIIGGREIYMQFIDVADRLIISKIPGDYQCDLFMDFVDYDNFNFIGQKDHGKFIVKIYDAKEKKSK